MLIWRHSGDVRPTRREHWSRVIAEQESSGLSIRAFCKQRGVRDHSFYAWRRRLARVPGVRFAELTTFAGMATASTIEILLTTGDRLHIPNGVDSATLRLVWEILRP